MIPIIEKDITEVQSGIILHQVNCIGIANGGVVKSIKNKYPSTIIKYQNYVNTYGKGSDLLGIALVDKVTDSLYVGHLFAQKGKNTFGRRVRNLTDMKGLSMALTRVAAFARDNKLDVHIPYGMGAVRAGGDWDDIDALVHQIFFGINVIYYNYTPRNDKWGSV